MNKPRITYIDLAKGLCMILVVYFHVKDNFYHISMPFDATIRMFHMPLFFVLSGMFFNEKVEFREFAVKKTNTLFIPFTFFYLTTAILLPCVLLCIGWNFSIEGGIGWHSLYAFIYPEMFVNTPIWFLWALFQLNLIFYALNYIANKVSVRYADLLLALFSLLVGAIGYGCGTLGYNLPMFLDSTFTSVPYFCMGYLLWKNKMLTHKTTLFCIWEALLCLLLTYIVAGGLNYRTNSFDVSFPATYIGGFAGSMFLILTSKIIGDIKVISYIGRYSLVVLCTHYLVMDVVCPIILKIKMPIALSLLLSLVLVIFTTCLIAPVLKRICPYVIGQKETIKL